MRIISFACQHEKRNEGIINTIFTGYKQKNVYNCGKVCITSPEKPLPVDNRDQEGLIFFLMVLIRALVDSLALISLAIFSAP